MKKLIFIFFLTSMLQLSAQQLIDRGIFEVCYSESKSLHEGDEKIKLQAHSDYIYKLPNLYNNDVDIMVESKAKELSILPFLSL